jgi:2-isopropylmalate synthase
MGQHHIRIFDTTLRDGEQSPGFSLRPAEKLQLARQIDALGVDIIEAGFPISSPADAESVRQIATEIRRPIIACLARCHRADLERAAWAIKPAAQGRIHTFIATSDLHLQAKLRMTREQCMEAAVESVRYARQHTFDVQFSAEDATRSDFDFLCRVVEAVIKVGATTINLPDTVGYSTPDELQDFFRRIRERVSHADNVVFSAHCHDDLGLAVANSLAAVLGGARQVECTTNGIGERAGNAALEEIVMALKIRSDRMPYTTSVDTRQIYPTSEMLSKLTGQGVQVNKAVVGRNAFAHEAGIHQDGMLKDRRTYEIMRAEDVGAPWNPLVLGKHSGRHAVQRRCADLGFTVEGAELIEVYRTLMAIADDRKVLTDQDVRTAIGALRPEHPATAAAHHDAIDPFDTPSAAAHHSMHESGYGHGV